jgi:Fe2+ transport system protein FeoA
VSGEPAECPLCGCRFKPEQYAACPACPLAKGCSLVCCPACGYSTIDPSRSSLVRLGRLFRGKPRLEKTENTTAMTLNDVVPGSHACIAGFSEDLPSQQREHLQAYGLVEGRKVRVLQHSPATVVRVEHLELALEAELAGKVRVTGEPGQERNRVRTRLRRGWPGRRG